MRSVRAQLLVTGLAALAAANVNALTEYGGTPLSFAVRYRNDQVAELLRQHGAKEEFDDAR